MTAELVPYEKMNFVWITNHYDFHLSGLCRHAGALCRFKLESDWEEPVIIYRVTRLDPLQRTGSLIHKWLFEACVGRHWTYPDRKCGERYGSRKPAWLHKLLSRSYFSARRFLP